MSVERRRVFDSILSGALVACALIVTGLVIRREVFNSASITGQRGSLGAAFIEHWKSRLRGGELLGLASAPVQLVEFADFECPYCADFEKTLKRLRQIYSAQIALTFFHFPIPGHRFAVPAARVAECAGDQGRFEAMHDQLFEGQDQFGLKPWADYATAAGVPDLRAFDACIEKAGAIPRVD